MNNLGKRIKILRTAKGWSLDELSSRTNIPKTTIWGIEKGSQTSMDNLDKIATAFGMNIYQLIDSEKNHFGANFDGTVYIEERIKFTEKTILKLIGDIYNESEGSFNLIDDDLEYITSSIKSYIINLVDFATHKNISFHNSQTSLLDKINKDNENK